MAWSSRVANKHLKATKKEDWIKQAKQEKEIYERLVKESKAIKPGSGNRPQ